MLTTNTQFEIEIRKLVQERIEANMEQMSHGNAPDFAAYQKLAGVIGGLRMIDELCDEAATIINQR